MSMQLPGSGPCSGSRGPCDEGSRWPRLVCVCHPGPHSSAPAQKVLLWALLPAHRARRPSKASGPAQPLFSVLLELSEVLTVMWEAALSPGLREHTCTVLPQDLCTAAPAWTTFPADCLAHGLIALNCLLNCTPQ